MIGFIITIIILLILLSISVWGNINLVKKQEDLEDYIETLEGENTKFSIVYDRIEDLVKGSRKRLNDLDDIGAFEADDSVGYFFNMLKAIQDEIEQYIK